jgi:hypothetical protein
VWGGGPQLSGEGQHTNRRSGVTHSNTYKNTHNHVPEQTGSHTKTQTSFKENPRTFTARPVKANHEQSHFLLPRATIASSLRFFSSSSFLLASRRRCTLSKNARTTVIHFRSFSFSRCTVSIWIS